jgi:membrane fusion protein, copper/silver efflux system
LQVEFRAAMKNFLLGFLMAAVLLAGGYYVRTHWIGKTNVKTAPEVKYHCPMHPTYISDRPGDCPICGMKLVPIEPSSVSGSHADHPPENSGSVAGPGSSNDSVVPGYVPVKISPDRIQTMGITLTEAARVSLDENFRTFGRVTFDETRVHHVHTRFEGYIEHMYVDYTGKYVKRGEPLFSLYSPELYATQNEYLLALRAREQRPRRESGSGIKDIESTVDLVASARERLALWNIGEDELNELERTRKPLRAVDIPSPVSGYVTAKSAVQGLKVTPADNLYDIVDLSTVWILADVYENSLPFIKVGQPATINLDYKPGKTWRGKVVFIDPTVDPSTRTIKARLEIANPNGELKPEMYASVILGGSRASGIAVPDSAVIATGERNIVFVSKKDGVFEPREVVLGVRVRNLYEIIQGVSEGEKVVTGANFLLDSESKLKAAISTGSGEHKHGP